jgi:ribosomal-protein-alanine N-acetyltransferase
MAPGNKPVALIPLTIRPFRPNDSPTIVGILRRSAEAAQWPAESYATLAASPSGILLVCEVGTQVIGFLAARQAADEAEILNIAIHEDFRRQGAASALVIAALEGFQRSDVVRIFLELRASNIAAHALYERHGFIYSGTRKAYYRDPPEDAVCMMKELSDTCARTKLLDLPS